MRRDDESSADFLNAPEFLEALLNGDWSPGQEHLDAGYPIYYENPDFPGYVIKEYPDGRRELLTVTDLGEITSVRDL